MNHIINTQETQEHLTPEQLALECYKNDASYYNAALEKMFGKYEEEADCASFGQLTHPKMPTNDDAIREQWLEDYGSVEGAIAQINEHFDKKGHAFSSVDDAFKFLEEQEAAAAQYHDLGF